MNNTNAITAVQRALAHYRRRKAHTPTNHSAREIAQMSLLAEYLHETHTPKAKDGETLQSPAQLYDSLIVSAAA